MIAGITHALVFINTHQKQKDTGVYAMVKLCFGNDDDGIAQLVYARTGRTKENPAGSGRICLSLPQKMQYTNGGVKFDIFTGKVALRILEIANNALSKVKDSGFLKLGAEKIKVFRVTDAGCEEIVSEPQAKK